MAMTLEEAKEMVVQLSQSERPSSDAALATVLMNLHTWLGEVGSRLQTLEELRSGGQQEAGRSVKEPRKR